MYKWFTNVNVTRVSGIKENNIRLMNYKNKCVFGRGKYCKCYIMFVVKRVNFMPKMKVNQLMYTMHLNKYSNILEYKFTKWKNVLLKSYKG